MYGATRYRQCGPRSIEALGVSLIKALVGALGMMWLHSSPRWNGYVRRIGWRAGARRQGQGSARLLPHTFRDLLIRSCRLDAIDVRQATSAQQTINKDGIVGTPCEGVTAYMRQSAIRTICTSHAMSASKVLFNARDVVWLLWH